MPLTQDRELEFFASSELIDLPVDDNVKVYKGAYVGRNRTSGLARPLQLGDEFLGVAYRTADNTVAGHAAGGIDARLFQQADVVDVLSGVALGDIGKEVYALDDSTLTLLSTGTSRIGRVVAVPSSGYARVRLQPVTAAQGQFEGYAIHVLSDATQTLTLNHVNRVLLMGNAAARTLTLPAASSVRAGGWIRVVKTNAAAFAITLDPNASETVDGAATLATVDAQYDCAHLLCTGNEWIVLSRDIA